MDLQDNLEEVTNCPHCSAFSTTISPSWGVLRLPDLEICQQGLGGDSRTNERINSKYSRKDAQKDSWAGALKGVQLEPASEASLHLVGALSENRQVKMEVEHVGQVQA